MSQFPAYDALEPKQRRFVDEYLVDCSGAKAARRAGYSQKTAASQGAQLLSNLKVQAALKERMASVAERIGLSAQKVVEEIARVAFSDMRRFTTWGPSGVTLNDSAALSDDDARCVAEVSETTSEKGGSIRFKLHDKMGALKELAERMGIDREMMRKLYPDLDPDTRKTRVLSLIKTAAGRADADRKVG